MGRHFAFSMLKDTLARKSTPPSVVAVVTNMSYVWATQLAFWTSS